MTALISSIVPDAVSVEAFSAELYELSSVISTLLIVIHTMSAALRSNALRVRSMADSTVSIALRMANDADSKAQMANGVDSIALCTAAADFAAL